jgi:hypothetical protein
MNTDKVLALAREAGYSTQIDVRNGLHTENIWGGELETAKVMRFAALIQREMEAENAEPVAWMNPENGVVIDARQKQQIGEGSGYPKFSIPLYTAIDRARSANETV